MWLFYENLNGFWYWSCVCVEFLLLNFYIDFSNGFTLNVWNWMFSFSGVFIQLSTPFSNLIGHWSTADCTLHTAHHNSFSLVQHLFRLLMIILAVHPTFGFCLMEIWKPRAGGWHTSHLTINKIWTFEILYKFWKSPIYLQWMLLMVKCYQ